MQPIYEFHISRRARDLYRFDENVLGTNGRLIVSGTSQSTGRGLAAARRIVERVHAVAGKSIPASDIYAAALIEEILHVLLRHYEKLNPGVFKQALEFLQEQLGVRLSETLARFVDAFPPSAVYRGEQSTEAYLEGVSEGITHRVVAMEEMLLVHVSNRNPALEAYREFFDESQMAGTAYGRSIALLTEFFARRPPLANRVGGTAETVIDILLSPSRTSPFSLEGQLQYLIDRWRAVLGPDLLQLVLRAKDFLREEIIRHAGHTTFRSPQPVPDFRGEADYERFSTDREWMPELVLVAKNTHVWLEQLSRKYKRWIRTLADIPNEELDLLARRGLTGLWLIGLWERSRASERIKKRMGQTDAAASAYSVNDYSVAVDLGGWDALSNLRDRARQRGIRLSVDMVPNHMGIDSKWVMEHPERFLSLDHSPYPAYSFNSENLSDDPRVGIHLEDHYYDKTDAAVVFLRRDLRTGSMRYIYHGNDGTSYPWNDTAQLDYSHPDVREAVIQTILQVARNFPIIRFDAAMTLAKKHIQRLWFPEPGAGGAIPSRAEHGMTRAEFEAAMPHEFWREVVDRVASEVPDTLLLAEAFWLLEGYFVRTLGMHRVYNSAFMHMLRDEENAKYRQLIKNTLEFDPQILKRYVNFMSNPDEKTAIEQFGSGDKYFGVCTVMATMPGLPMFGHGQVEGLRERYGMEFRVPRLDEQPDDALVRGHEWKIFPLLHRRNVFAGADQFHLFDFYTSGGRVNENVLAYCNRRGSERALVLYHNRYATARGWVRVSAAALDRSSGQLVQRSLAEALDLPRSGFAIFTDYVTHLEYVRDCAELWDKGLYAELAAYEHQAFLDWRIVYGADWDLACRVLNGAGVESVESMVERKMADATLGTEEQVEPMKIRLRKGRRPTPVVNKKTLGGKKVTGKATRKKAVMKDVAPRKVSATKLTAKKPKKETVRGAQNAKRVPGRRTAKGKAR
jgi:glycosidase